MAGGRPETYIQVGVALYYVDPLIRILGCNLCFSMYVMMSLTGGPGGPSGPSIPSSPGAPGEPAGPG